MRALTLIPTLALCGLFVFQDAEPDGRAGKTPPVTEVKAESPGSARDGSWRRSSLWDDGRAEFSAYRVLWRRYERLNPGRAFLIAVKEPWAPDLDVKADRPRPDGFDVIKLNHIRDVPTGIYTYHQMASVFMRRDDGRLRKLATTSSEGCGLSTADMTRGVLRTRSYFDGQGNRETRWPEGALPEDGLPLLLRDYVTGPIPARIQVFPSLLTGRFPPLKPIAFEIRREEDIQEKVAAGTFEAVRIRLVRKDRELSFTFEKDSPHRMLRLETGDGTTYELLKSERIPYWSMNDPDGGKWIPEAIR